MYPLGIVGTPEVETPTLVERFAERLADRGRVAVIECAPDGETDGGTAIGGATGRTGHHRVSGAAEVHVVDEGGWIGHGERELPELLAELAPEFEYAVVTGEPEASIPTVAVGDRDHAGETVASAPTAAEVDVDAAVMALEETEPLETLESLVAEIKQSPRAEYAGAIATFTGRVRRKEDPEDDPTEYLAFEKYDGVAEARMAAIGEELEERDGVQDVLMHHRTGVVESGEDIVFVVVLAGHREEAFETVSDGIDRLKAEVPLFKKEVTVDGEFWAHQHEPEHRVE